MVWGVLLLVSPMRDLIAASNDNSVQQPIAVVNERIIYNSDLGQVCITDGEETLSSNSIMALFVAYAGRMIIDEEIEARQISVSSHEVKKAVVKSLERNKVTETTFPEFRGKLLRILNDRLQAAQSNQQNSGGIHGIVAEKSTDMDERNAREVEIRNLQSSIPDTFDDLIQQSFGSMKRSLQIESLQSSLIQSKDIVNNDRSVHEGKLFRNWLNGRMQKLNITFYNPKLEIAWKKYFAMLNGKVEQFQPNSADSKPNDFDLPPPRTTVLDEHQMPTVPKP